MIKKPVTFLVTIACVSNRWLEMEVLLLIDGIGNIVSKFTCAFFFMLQIFKQNCNVPKWFVFKGSICSSCSKVFTNFLNH